MKPCGHTVWQMEKFLCKLEKGVSSSRQSHPHAWTRGCRKQRAHQIQAIGGLAQSMLLSSVSLRQSSSFVFLPLPSLHLSHPPLSVKGYSGKTMFFPDSTAHHGTSPRCAIWSGMSFRKRPWQQCKKKHGRVI